MALKKGKLYRVDWFDSTNHAMGWEDKVGVEISAISSYGILIAKNKNAITLVQNVCFEGAGSPCACNAITIPRGCIKSVRRLTVKKSKNRGD